VTPGGQIMHQTKFLFLLSIDISDEQLREVKNISSLLDENATDVKANAFFGSIDYESEFMRSYRGNLDDNAASASNVKNTESEEVESWEMREEATLDPIVESTKPPKSK
jgi:hypothetical protein